MYDDYVDLPRSAVAEALRRRQQQIPGLAGTGINPSSGMVNSLPNRFWDDQHYGIDMEDAQPARPGSIDPDMHPGFFRPTEAPPVGYSDPDENVVMGGGGAGTLMGAMTLDQIDDALLNAAIEREGLANESLPEAPEEAPEGEQAIQAAPMPEASKPEPEVQFKPAEHVIEPFSDKTMQERAANRTLNLYKDVPLEEQTELERKLTQEILSTDTTRKNQLYADGIIFADHVLSMVDREGTDWFAENFTGDNPATVKIPFGVGNYFVGTKRQAYEMAKRMFINGMLRPQTGATINYQSEEPVLRKTYFPEIGDTEMTVQLKRAARRQAVDSTVFQAGPLYKRLDPTTYMEPEFYEALKPEPEEEFKAKVKTMSTEDILKALMAD